MMRLFPSSPCEPGRVPDRSNEGSIQRVHCCLLVSFSIASVATAVFDPFGTGFVVCVGSGPCRLNRQVGLAMFSEIVVASNPFDWIIK